jgi:tRNA A37 threonylcarbamoyladenosine dehydratase
MSLIRSGVSRIRVIDYDIVTLSSLNRHAFALRSDVGKLKVRVVKDYAKKINPSLIIETIDDAFDMKYAEDYILKNIEKPSVTIDTSNSLTSLTSSTGTNLNLIPDIVIDCIDDLDAKSDLIKFCYDKKIRMISSMGAGARSDPTMIRLADFHYVTGEKLAKRLKANYKKRWGEVIPNFKTVFSIEKSSIGLTELEPHQKEKPEDYRINENERIRSLPVFASLPAIFGQTLAASVLFDLAKKNENSEEKSNTIQIPENAQEIKINPIKPPSFEDPESFVGSVSVKKLYENFISSNPTCELFFEDFENIAKKFDYKSSVSKKPGHKINFCVWDVSKKVEINNIVLLIKSEANKHFHLKDEESLKKFYGEKVYEEIVTVLNGLC